MIPKVARRGKRVSGLLRYLFGPGKAEEHVNPRLVASWRSAEATARLEPPVDASGKRDFGRLVSLLELPVRAGRNPPRLTVWHCSLRTAEGDRHLTDGQWSHIAGEVMAAVGLAPHGDDRAVRWVAVRHADDHIHLVATLVRQDGRTAWAWRDKLAAQAACRQIEERYGLRRVAPIDGTAPRRPTLPELAKAQRQGRPRAVRDELRHRVRVAMAAATNLDDFVARLRDWGVLIELRVSTVKSGEYTGYKVALVDNLTAAGTPVWYSGGKLAPDLTLPRLCARWSRPETSRARLDRHQLWVSAPARARATGRAARAVRLAAEQLRRAGANGEFASQAQVQAGADVLAALAAATEGRRPGPLSAAAELFDRAARDQRGRVTAHTARSYELRALSRLVFLMGRVSGDDDTTAALGLVLDLARLADSLAWLRERQQRRHQAEAAQHAASVLLGVAATGRLVTASATVRATSRSTMDSDKPRRLTPVVGEGLDRRHRRPNR